MHVFSEPSLTEFESHAESDARIKCITGSKSRALLLCCAGLVVIYSALFLFYNRLRFPPIWDEEHFLATSQLFGKSLVPSLELLRNYKELNTPLPFIIFGTLEHFTGDGLFAGRFLNLVISLLIVISIGAPLGGKSSRSILAAVGLLAVPYYLWLSTHFYTDILAAFFVFAAFWLYLRSKHVLSCLCFILAIACRQYMLAFPLAVAAHEFIATFRDAFRFSSLRSATDRFLRSTSRWIMPGIAALTILFWFWWFHGLAPSSGIAIKETPQVQKEIWSISAGASLYFLACLGLYFVIPEWILFNRRVNPRALFNLKNTAIALGLSVLFVAFPPDLNVTHGLLTKLARLLPFDFPQTALVYCLALLTCARFSRFNLAFWVVLINSGLMLKAHAWDKYVLPLLVVFWYLKSIEMLDRDSQTSPEQLEDSGARNVRSLPQSAYSLPDRSF